MPVRPYDRIRFWLLFLLIVGVLIGILGHLRNDIYWWNYKPITSSGSASIHEVDPDFAYKQAQSGSLNLTVEDQLSHKKVTLSKDQQADLVRLLYTKSFWTALPVS